MGKSHALSLHHQMFGIQREHKCKWQPSCFVLITILAVSKITFNLAGTLIFFFLQLKVVTPNLKHVKGTKFLLSDRIGMGIYSQLVLYCQEIPPLGKKSRKQSEKSVQSLIFQFRCTEGEKNTVLHQELLQFQI